ncbi:MAG: hypothetical protein QMD36_05670 [Candidatus Aenigmarchaeota archaeon]|nr:hypothetical protein [Candidatus Aenigmarchaeota archaeon]
MSEKARGYIKNLELLLDSLEDIKSVFEGKMTVQSLYVLEEMTEEAKENMSPVLGYVNSLEKLLYRRDWMSGKLEIYRTPEQLEIMKPDAAKDMYLLTRPIANTYKYLDSLRLECEFHRRRMQDFNKGELKQDRPSFEIEMEEFQEVNKLKLEYRIKDLKHLIESLKK